MHDFAGDLMIQRLVGGVVLGLVGVLALASPAQAQQSVSFQLGSFMPRAEDARVQKDVLVVDRRYLLFDIKDFAAINGGGEWLIDMGDFIETGVGLSYYQRTVPAIHAELVNQNGQEIQQDLKLRIIPLVAIARIFPFGHKRAVQPYIGAGLGVYFWRYSETGEFVDDANAIFRDAFVGSGTSVGPVATFGLRGRVSQSVDLGMEVRMQWGKGDLSTDFLSDTIDLGGVNLLATIRYRF